MMKCKLVVDLEKEQISLVIGEGNVKEVLVFDSLDFEHGNFRIEQELDEDSQKAIIKKLVENL